MDKILKIFGNRSGNRFSGFLGPLITNLLPDLENSNGGSNMTDKISKKFHFFGKKLVLQGFLWLLITNLLSDLKNSK